MPCSAYVGLTGSGKSYSVVTHVIIPALKNKRPVFTNIPMHNDLLLKDFGQEIITFDLKDIIDNENWWSEVFIAGSILVLDEVWRLWPSGMKASQVRDTDKEFLAEHRHLVMDGRSTEIVLVTQDLAQIANFARTLIDQTIRTENLERIGLKGRFKVYFYFGAVTGQKPPKSKVDKVTTLQKYDKKYYQYYKSHTKSDGGAGVELKTDSRTNVLKSGVVYGGIAFIIFGCLFSYYGYNQLRQSFGFTDDVNSTDIKTIDDNKIKSSNHKIKTKPESKPKPKEPEFLADSEQIYIVFNNGIYPKIEYRFRIEFEKTYTIASLRDLASLDYKITPVNDCLVKIVGNDYSGYAMCRGNNEPDGFFEENAAKFVTTM